MTHVNLAHVHSVSIDALSALNASVDSNAEAAGVSAVTVELLRIRVSQINGCASCLRLHTREALKQGVTPERLALVSAWRECSYFDAVEEAALTLAETITEIADGGMNDATYDAVADVLTPAQFSALAWVAIVINAWNRVALTSRWPVTPPSPYDAGNAVVEPN
ncbi:carboxymuconolactone decarboxylase family protein [Alloalcanivorax gelatiniphagus]